jgi:CBS domain containing-hemolysin-like protein
MPRGPQRSQPDAGRGLLFDRHRSPTGAPSIDTALGLVAVALLIIANGLFVAAEFALVAVEPNRLDRQIDAGDRRAKLVRSLLRRLSFHLSGAQLGITVTSLVLGFIAEPAIGGALAPLLEPVVGESGVTGVSVAIAFVLATVAQMVMGELVPKGIAIARPDPTARRLAPFVAIYGTVCGPLVKVLDGAANWTVRRLGMEPAEELSHVRTLPEFELLVSAATEEGTLAGSASELLARSIRFGEKTAADALIPRPDMRALGSEESVSDLVAAARSTGHSRFPVFGADLDDVRGIVHVRSAHAIPYAQRAVTPVAEIMTGVLAVPESRELEDLLVDMRRERQHLAVVVDEYGGTAGIVTLEDIVEEIVGEIGDEHDAPTANLTQDVRPGVHVLSGGLHADEVEALTGFEIPEGEYETLAGFVLDALGHIPKVGEKLSRDGWVVEVVEMDRHRIAEVELQAPPPTPTEDEADGDGR